MKKLLKPIDVLRLSGAGALDVFDDLCDPFGMMSKGCKELYGWVPPRYRRHNYFRTVSRALKTADIAKTVKDGEVYLRLTSQGKEKIKRDFPLLSFQKRRWDGKWRVVFYDILETNKRVRERLREKLRSLGFGMIQRSVWITPHDLTKDLREFIETNKLGEKVFILEGKHLLAGNPKSLASRIWQLEELNKEYEKIYQEIDELEKTYVKTSDRRLQPTQEKKERWKEASDLGKRSDLGEEGEKKMREIRSEYLQVLLGDPFLPKELLPEDWMGEKVKREIRKLR